MSVNPVCKIVLRCCEQIKLMKTCLWPTYIFGKGMEDGYQVFHLYIPGDLMCSTWQLTEIGLSSVSFRGGLVAAGANLTALCAL